MKMKTVVQAGARIALSACLAVVCLSPASAIAASNDSAGASFSPATQESVDVSVKSTPKPKKISKLKAILLPSGKFKIRWNAKKVKGLKSQSYTVRYTSSVRYLWDGKTKKTSKTHCTLPKHEIKLKGGYKYLSGWEVQVRANAKYGNKTLHSKWATYEVLPVVGSSSANVTCRDTASYGRNYERYCQSLVPQSLVLESNETGAVTASWQEPKDKGDGYGYRYYVRYAYNKSMKGAKEKKGNSGTSVTLSGLKSGKTVYVQVCSAEWNGLGGSYARSSRWSAAKSIKVAPSDASSAA